MRRKVKIEKYKPKGRIGYISKTNFPYYYNIIVEKLQEVNEASRIKILEVDVHRDCTKTKDACLRHCGIGDWVSTSSIKWGNRCTTQYTY